MDLDVFCSAVGRLFAWVLRNSVSATVLVLLVALVQRLGRRTLPPFWRYGLWLLVAARLVLPNAPPASFSVFNLGWLGAKVDRVEESPLPESPADSGRTTHWNSAPALNRRGIPPVHGAKTLAPRVEAFDARPDRRSPLPALLWLAGVFAYLLLVFVQHRKLARWIKRQAPLADLPLATLLAEAKATLGVRRHLTVVPVLRACAPALFGVRHPVLLMPEKLVRTLEPAELRQILLHELVHLKHHDVPLNYLLLGVQALHWFNPAVWLALRRLRAERESYCDALVLKRLDAPERRIYGSALVKVCEHLARPVYNPNLVPIFGHQPQIHRRILMITHFQPTSRRAAAASLLLALGLGGFTFTKAVDNQNPPSTPAPAQPAPAPKKPTADPEKTRDQAIKVLSEALAQQQVLMRQKQQELDELREKFGIADDGQPNAPFAEALGKLESLKIEAQGECKRALTLYTMLTNMSRSDLRQAAPTVVSDSLLNALLERAQTAQQKLAELLDRQTPGHPEVVSANKLLDHVNKQIEQRLDGILAGLKLKMGSEKARAEELDKLAEQYKYEMVHQAIRRRPYEQAKRDLESLQKTLDLLNLRLIEKRIDQQIGQDRSPQP